MSKKQNKASKVALEQLHAAIAEALATRIKAGNATAADLAVAVRFVKENGISILIDPQTPDGSVLTGVVLPDAGSLDDEFEEVLGGFN